MHQLSHLWRLCLLDCCWCPQTSTEQDMKPLRICETRLWTNALNHEASVLIYLKTGLLSVQNTQSKRSICNFSLHSISMQLATVASISSILGMVTCFEAAALVSSITKARCNSEYLVFNSRKVTVLYQCSQTLQKWGNWAEETSPRPGDFIHLLTLCPCCIDARIPLHAFFEWRCSTQVQTFIQCSVVGWCISPFGHQRNLSNWFNQDLVESQHPVMFLDMLILVFSELWHVNPAPIQNKSRHSTQTQHQLQFLFVIS